MLIVFDVGNTETTIGLFDGDVLISHWRVTTDLARTADELGLLIRGVLETSAVPREAILGAAIGSVVPSVTAPLVGACARYLQVQPLVVDASTVLPIRIDVDEPLTVGADRLINTLAASRLYGCDTICVDLGTATTFDCITADGVFLGGVIMPGVRTSADTLTRRTAKLPATELRAPTQVIGRRTEDCIRSGVLYGAADAIDGMVRRIKGEWPRAELPLVVATGGLATVVQPLCGEIDRVEPNLTLIGLRLAFELTDG
jgi:type III pantothenate kinase